MPRRCRGIGAMHPKGACSASLHFVGIAPYGRSVGVRSLCVMDQVRDDRCTDEHWLDHIALKDAIARLDDRQRSILALRFCQGKTQMEVSTEIGISQAQVSRLEKGAISAIKKNM